MITYATYYDHMERAHYDPVLIVENWNMCDRRVVFAANEAEMNVLKAHNIDADIINIDIDISNPTHIPIAQNACVRYCFDVLGTDWLMYAQGDQYMTPAGDASIHAFIMGNPSLISTVSVMHIQLYAYLWNHQSPVTISHKSAPVVYDVTSDGATCNVHNPAAPDGNGWFHDVGYMGLPQYAGKMNSHRHIWNDGDPYKAQWLALYAVDKDAAVRMIYKTIKRYMRADINPLEFSVYENTLTRMGLIDDYNYCMSILRRM